MKKRMRPLWAGLLAVFVLLFVLSFVFMLQSGGKGKIFIELSDDGRIIHYDLKQEDGDGRQPEILTVTGERATASGLLLSVSATEKGKAEYLLSYEGETGGGLHKFTVRSGKLGLLWLDGVPQGSEMLTLVLCFGLLIIFARLIAGFHELEKRTPYAYGLASVAGAILFVLFSIITYASVLFDCLKDGRMMTIESLVQGLSDMPTEFGRMTLPVLIAVGILMAVTNVILIKREGKSPGNILGVSMSLLFIGLIILERLIRDRAFSFIVSVSEILLIPVFSAQFFFSAAVSYTECMTIAIVACALKAAYYKPAFDKDYIIILGCRIRPDGTLYPLIKGRVDRALSFSKEQSEKTGKDVVFVPSGGRGADEKVSEGEAMRQYLLSKGIPEDRILTEDNSENTYQNMLYSKVLIEKRDPEAKVAFSTTNYHVFRSGIHAYEAGLRAEGMGSPTAWFYWPNAFVRELAAMFLKNRRAHLTALLMLAVFSVLFSVLLYIMII